MTEKKTKRLIRATEIEALSIAEDGICISDLTVQCAERILSHVQRTDIGTIIFLSQTPDYLSPRRAIICRLD